MEQKKQEHDRQMKDIEECLKKISHKIAICSGKGGVGKTTVAANLATYLAKQKLRVGILDVDITGPNIPKVLNLMDQHLGVDVAQKKFLPVQGSYGLKVMSMAFLLENNDSPVIWRGPMKMGAIRQFLAEGEWGELDYLIIDLPPGTSDELLDIMQLIPDAGVVIVTTPNEAALNVSRKAIGMAKNMNRNIVGIIENMSGMDFICPHCSQKTHIALFGEGGGIQAATDFDIPFLGSIPLIPQLREMADQGIPIVLPDSSSEDSAVIVKIIDRIRGIMEKNSDH